MSTEHTEWIETLYEAFAARDFETVLAHFADDMEWIAAENSPLADQSPYHGIDAVRTGVFDRIAAGFEALSVEADEIFECAGRVIVLGHYRGRFHGSEDEFRAQVAHLWTMRDGKAVKFQQYVDTLHIARSAPM